MASTMSSAAKRPSRLFRNLSAKIASVPMILTALVVFVGGTLWTVLYSFTNSRLLPRLKFVGLDQYERLWATPRWLVSIENLAIYGVLSLIFSLVIGFVLARQITGAVHDLFTGTLHVRAGNFGHQIPVRARDQLGELAESFNLMTTEVTTLLGEMAEKGRLEQEMFAAREIQQKLLPHGPLRVTGLAVTAFCGLPSITRSL